jgi:DNA transformation protein
MDADFIRELFAEFRTVTVRRMFGGLGVYAEGTMFALVADERLHLKADPADAERFVREGCAPFSYVTKKGARTITSYWRIPDRLYDDPAELALWAAAALAVAQAKQKSKERRPLKRP